MKESSDELRSHVDTCMYDALSLSQIAALRSGERVCGGAGTPCFITVGSWLFVWRLWGSKVNPFVVQRDCMGRRLLHVGSDIFGFHIYGFQTIVQRERSDKHGETRTAPGVVGDVQLLEHIP